MTNPPISLAEEIERIERAPSVTEVARLLSLCRASVHRYIDAGISQDAEMKTELYFLVVLLFAAITTIIANLSRPKKVSA